MLGAAKHSSHFDWTLLVAIVGSSAAVAVAVFTGLAYRYGLKEGRERKADAERRAAIREQLGVLLREGLDLRAGLDQLAETRWGNINITQICEMIDQWAVRVEKYLATVEPHLVSRFRIDPAGELVPRFDRTQDHAEVTYYRNYIYVRTMHLHTFLTEFS
jgi:hypothetical protein